MGKQQHGFTLIELIMVMMLLGLLSAVAIGLLPTTEQYNARLAADKWLTFFRLGQRMALIKQNASALMHVQISENTSLWDALLSQGTQTLQSAQLEREGVVVKISSTNFTAACSALPNVTFPQSFYFDGDGNHVTSTRSPITNNVRICFVGGEASQELCLSPSGFAYASTCLP